MNTKKIIYEVTITICNYYRIYLKYRNIGNAQDLIASILQHVDADKSDAYSIVIIPTIEEPEPIEDGKEEEADE